MSQLHDDFKEVVNMTPKQLEEWLETEESKSVGQHKDGAKEALGHESGRHIVEILHKKQAGYDKSDEEQMERTVSYVRRHLAQRPKGDVEDTRWRHSLMNWGHDPLKG